MKVGTGEYLTGDGASTGKAGEIYKDAIAESSNRRYTVGNTNDPSTSTKDKDILAKYINSDGSYKDGVFKISSAYDEFGANFKALTNMDDFTMLVINDDSDRSGDITPFIKSYIRLVTNAAGQPNSNTYDKAAYSCGSKVINELYEVVINPCYYDSSAGKFVLGEDGDQGLQKYGIDDTNAGKYWLDSTKADSESRNPYQFSLIDVQFKDPTDTSKIAYHLYVPVLTRKMLTAEFSAVSMSETKYYRTPYAELIASELEALKSPTNPSQLVESTNEWTTTFIRFAYPKNQISDSYNWNFEKSITLSMDNNFETLPAGTRIVLLDPNANADKFYTMSIDSTYPKDSNSEVTVFPLDLSQFTDETGQPFTPQDLSSILADQSTSGDDKLYEDYYISMYVPKAGDGFTHSVTFGCVNDMSHTVGEEVYKSNIDAKLYSRVVLGDLFNHEITRFEVFSGDGSAWNDSVEMVSSTNNWLRTEVTATVQIKNRNAGSYLATGSGVYHSFFVTLTSHFEDQRVSDIIYGVGNIYNNTTYTYTKNETNHTVELDDVYPGSNYFKLDTGRILEALYDPQGQPVVTINSVMRVQFNDVTAFPYNPDKKPKIGTQVSVKSSLAYREQDLLFSALNVLKGDPEGKYYYSTTRNNAELSFNAVPADDETDEIGYKTKNRSLLGVNGRYGDKHPVLGRSMYNVDKIVDYESAEELQYTIELYKKVTDEDGTSYEKVDDISKYLENVDLTDTKVELETDPSDPSKYVYTGTIDHDHPLDNEKAFEAVFSCTVLTGDAGQKEYANYKIQLTAELIGPANSWKDAYLIYTNAKFDPTVIDATG